MFKKWANQLTKRYGEWETEYLHWDRIYNAFKRVLIDVPIEDLQPDVYDLILYTLARDNEVENVLAMLIENPIAFIVLANHALSFSDFEAKWQIAYGLGEIDGKSEEIHELLSKYLDDEHEYVRRRASFTLEKINLNSI